MYLIGICQKGEWKSLNSLLFLGKTGAGPGNGDWETDFYFESVWFLFWFSVIYKNLVFFIYEWKSNNPFKLLYIIMYS